MSTFRVTREKVGKKGERTNSFWQKNCYQIIKRPNPTHWGLSFSILATFGFGRDDDIDDGDCDFAIGDEGDTTGHSDEDDTAGDEDDTAGEKDDTAGDADEDNMIITSCCSSSSATIGAAFSTT